MLTASFTELLCSSSTDRLFYFTAIREFVWPVYRCDKLYQRWLSCTCFSSLWSHHAILSRMRKLLCLLRQKHHYARSQNIEVRNSLQVIKLMFCSCFWQIQSSAPPHRMMMFESRRAAVSEKLSRGSDDCNPSGSGLHPSKTQSSSW